MSNKMIWLWSLQEQNCSNLKTVIQVKNFLKVWRCFQLFKNNSFILNIESKSVNFHWLTEMYAIICNKFKYTYSFHYLVFLCLTNHFGWSKIIDNQLMAKLANCKILIILSIPLFIKNTFPHFWSYETSSSTNTTLFTVRFY